MKVWIFVCIFQLIGQHCHSVDAACGDTVTYREVNESTPAGSVIQPGISSFTLTTYSQYSCYFGVVTSSLVLAKPMDLENFTSCMDGSKTPLASVPAAILLSFTCADSSTDNNFVLGLVDIDEFAPAFISSLYVVNVSEAALPGDQVIQLSSFVRDADKSNQQTFNFLLLSGSNGKFATGSATSGILRINDTLDYDYGLRSYLLNISAAELASNAGSKPVPLTGYATVQVLVTDVDDQNPAFLSSDYGLSFMENDTGLLGQWLETIPRLLARDQDLGINQTVNYAIELGNTINNTTFLEINSTTGLLRLTSVIDRETLAKNPMWLRVRAFQTDKPDVRTAVAFVLVTVTDKNDNAPVMSAPSYSASFAENSPNGAFVIQVAATDADFGSNATLEYKLSDLSGAFQIDNATGAVRVRNSSVLDRETTPTFNLSVWAAESQTPERWSSGVSWLLIQLTDVNDNPPAFSQSAYAFNVSADAAVGTQVGVVSATDPDVGQNALVHYRLTFGTGGGLVSFQLDSVNGSLTVASLLMSATSPILLLAQAEDQAEPAALRQRSSVVLTVAVLPLVTTASTPPPTPTTSTMPTSTSTSTVTTSTSAATTSTAATSTVVPTTASTTAAAAAVAVWNASTTVISVRQFNETHVIMEIQTIIFDSGGRSVAFNQSTLSPIVLAAATTTVAATTTATVATASSTSTTITPTTTSTATTTGASTITTSTTTTAATTATATTPAASTIITTPTAPTPPVTSTATAAVTQSSSSPSTVGAAATVPAAASPIALIVLCILIALLLAAALTAAYFFWKRRPPGAIGLDVGTPVAAAVAAAAIGGPSSKGKLAKHQDSSRINYSEFYYDDKDVSGTPIMVMLNSGDMYQRPPSYTHLPGPSGDRIAKVDT